MYGHLSWFKICIFSFISIFLQILAQIFDLFTAWIYYLENETNLPYVSISIVFVSFPAFILSFRKCFKRNRTDVTIGIDNDLPCHSPLRQQIKSMLECCVCRFLIYPFKALVAQLRGVFHPCIFRQKTTNTETDTTHESSRREDENDSYSIFAYQIWHSSLHSSPQFVFQLSLLMMGRWTLVTKNALFHNVEDNVDSLEVSTVKWLGFIQPVAFLANFIFIIFTALIFNEEVMISNEIANRPHPRCLPNVLKLAISFVYYLATLIFRGSVLAWLLTCSPVWCGVVIYALFYLQFLAHAHTGHSFTASIRYAVWSLLIPFGHKLRNDVTNNSKSNVELLQGNMDSSMTAGQDVVYGNAELEITLIDGGEIIRKRYLDQSAECHQNTVWSPNGTDCAKNGSCSSGATQTATRLLVNNHMILNLLILGGAFVYSLIYVNRSRLGGVEDLYYVEDAFFNISYSAINTVFLPSVGLTLAVSTFFGQIYKLSCL